MGGSRQSSPPSRRSHAVDRQPPRPKWIRRSYQSVTPPPRDWVQLSVASLPGLAAVIALIFTSLAIRATNAQLQIAEQGQITDRYNAAITNLGSASVDVRLGGIYALQRIMQDSRRDRSTVIAVLCAFVRDQAAARSLHPAAAPRTLSVRNQPPADLQAALTVVANRNTAYDRPAIDINFSHADLAGVDLSGAHLAGAHLRGVNLSGANLTAANLAHADLSFADLVGTSFSDAHLPLAELYRADLARADLFGTDCTDADFQVANLSGADLYLANLTQAFFSGANLFHADFSRTNLSGATFSGAKNLPAGIHPTSPPRP